MKQYHGALVAPADAKFAVVASRFNEFITSKLLGGCVDSLDRHGVDDDNVEVFWCPGSWEQPVLARRLADTGQYAAVICLGAVIRGGTPHFDYVAGECVRGIAAASSRHGVPVGFGVLTVDTIEQAIERAGTKAGNKGEEATLAVIEMVNTLRRLG